MKLRTLIAPLLLLAGCARMGKTPPLALPEGIVPITGTIQPDGLYIQLTAPFAFTSLGMAFTAPAGFIGQYAHTPRAVWPFFPPFGRYTPAAMAHDYLYEIDPMLRHSPVGRALADWIFLDLMTRLGCPWYERYPMYLAVRMFGWFYWAQDRKGA